MDLASPQNARPRSWGAAKVGAVWRAFDLQIATYAALLACFGLAMAYSNSAAGGGDVLQPGSVFLRGLGSRRSPGRSTSCSSGSSGSRS